MSDFEPIPYRIRIGVTGHRSLPDGAAVEALVKKAIDSELENLFSDESRQRIERVRRQGTTPIRYSAVTPLAEGADRVVARAVCSYDGARLDAVLPLALEDYLEDFQTEESREEFHGLLARSRRPVNLRHNRIGAEPRTLEEAANLRRSAYERGGQYVVSHCDVLIAIWDGQQSRGRGGTAEIVEYAVAQLRPVIRVWDGSYEVYHRAHGLDATALDAVDRFNRAPVTREQRTLYVKNLERDYFESPETAKEIPAAAREIVQRYLLPYYVQASLVAKSNQRQFYRAGRSIYLLSSLAVGCVAFAVLVENIAAAGFAAEFILLAITWYALQRSQHRGSHQAWMENRFLAERIRSGIFLAICGIDAAPIEVLPFMGQAHTVDDWMVRVYDEIWNQLPRLPDCTESQCMPLNQYVREQWIESQISFHRGKRQRERRSRILLEKAAHIVLPVTMAAAGFHIALKFLPEPIQRLRWLGGGLTFVAILFPAVAASLAGMMAQREHLRLEKRSESMAPQLEYLSRRLASATDPGTFEALLHQVDEVTLRETQDWLMLMRFVVVRH